MAGDTAARIRVMGRGLAQVLPAALRNIRAPIRAPNHGETHANHGRRTLRNGERSKPKSRTRRSHPGIEHRIFPITAASRRRRNTHTLTAQKPRYKPGLATPISSTNGHISARNPDTDRQCNPHTQLMRSWTRAPSRASRTKSCNIREYRRHPTRKENQTPNPECHR